jgi:hypothetical protein
MQMCDYASLRAVRRPGFNALPEWRCVQRGSGVRRPAIRFNPSGTASQRGGERSCRTGNEDHRLGRSADVQHLVEPFAVRRAGTQFLDDRLQFRAGITRLGEDMERLLIHAVISLANTHPAESMTPYLFPSATERAEGDEALPRAFVATRERLEYCCEFSPFGPLRATYTSLALIHST